MSGFGITMALLGVVLALGGICGEIHSCQECLGEIRKLLQSNMEKGGKP